MQTFRTLIAIISGILGVLVIAPFIILGLPFWLTAIIIRTLANKLEPKYVPWKQLVEFDPNLGWKSKANLNNYGIADDVFHITTDSQGMRGKSSLVESEVVVIGDSLAWGYGVDDKKMFSELNPNLRIKPVAAPGYDMVQGLLLMRQLSKKLKGKLVVWFIYYGNDLYDNLFPDYEKYRAPFVRQVNDNGEWEIVTSHISSKKWTLRTIRQANMPMRHDPALYGPTFLSKRVYSATKKR